MLSGFGGVTSNHNHQYQGLLSRFECINQIMHCTYQRDGALADWSSLHLLLLDLWDKRLSTSTDQYVESARHVRCENGAQLEGICTSTAQLGYICHCNSQRQSNNRHDWIVRVFASVLPYLWYRVVLLFYCTLTSTLEYLPTARSGYRWPLFSGFSVVSCHALHFRKQLRKV